MKKQNNTPKINVIPCNIDLYNRIPEFSGTPLLCRVRDYASRVMWRELASLKADEKIKVCNDNIARFNASMLNVDTAIIGPESARSFNENLQTMIEAEKAEIIKIRKSLAEVHRLPEMAFIETKTDKELKDEWKNATTSIGRNTAVVRWFRANGINVTMKDVESFVAYLENPGSSRKDVKNFVDGGSLTHTNNLNMKTFFAVLVDVYIQKGAWKLDNIPYVLLDTYKAMREKAIAEAEAKKAAKKADREARRKARNMK